ncbi:hypothetical protein [Halomonas sp. C05BenzN]|uniref:hypothetical protein n=1 Tax=Halomonas sp. C05BenzN TaxID=3411041 RepID=UPI003B94F20C
MVNEFIDLKLVYVVLMLLALAVSLLSLTTLLIILLLHSEEIDSYFDSPDFSLRGAKVIWPYGVSKMLVYGVFLIFHSTRVVQKKFPHACQTINVEQLPKKSN